MLHQSPSVRVCADDQVATLWLDFPGPTANALDHARLDEIDAALSTLAGRPGWEVLVVRSARPGGFCTGIDPAELASLSRPDDWAGLAAHGQRVLGRLAALSRRRSTVAYIDGPCLGAGLELALACTWRLAVARPDTRFAFDHAALGLCPAWGGTYRLTRLVGPARALPLIAGRVALSARQAAACGLADRAFSPRQAKVQLWLFCQSLLLRPRQPWDGPRLWTERWRSWLPGHGRVAWSEERTRAESLPEGGRAAVRSGLDAAQAGWAHGRADGLAEERRRFAWLGQDAGPAVRLAARSVQLRQRGPGMRTPPPARVVGVVGDGERAAAVAFRAASRGGEVVCWVPPEDGAADALKARVARRFAEAVAGGWLSPLEGELLAGNVRASAEVSVLESADVILEASDGPPASRAALLADAGRSARPAAVVAALDAPEAADALALRVRRPSRFAALHAWPSWDEPRAVELASGPGADPDALAVLAEWLGRVGLTWLPVGPQADGVLGAVNDAFRAEVRRLLGEGHSPSAVASECRRAGLPEPEEVPPTGAANLWPAGTDTVATRLLGAVADAANACVTGGRACPDAVRALLASAGWWPAWRGDPLEAAVPALSAGHRPRGPHFDASRAPLPGRLAS